MKRRVSLAISAIGNPKIIFMDEPTTGMDPKTRREIWEMVKNLKKDKVIVLTTHAMEEAEALADRIVVVAGGELKCIGI
jgi:ABC-type multidrug transport system ATPase subunit